MNAQEIFDTVAKHLAAQGRRAYNGDNCVYRGSDGLRCAVGCLIRDDEYKPEMDTPVKNSDGTTKFGTSIDNLIKRGLLPARLRPFVAILDQLQSVHDDATTGAKLIGELNRTAAKHGLSPAILDTLTFPDKWA